MDSKIRKTWGRNHPSKTPQHVTLTERMGVNLTQHRCPQCSYVAWINWATTPFIREIIIPSDAENRSTLHVDRETVMEVAG
jgi:hypothetical protein